jgi:hypothetical protein
MKLFEMFVEFTATGASTVKAEVLGLKAGADALGAALTAAGAAGVKALGGVTAAAATAAAAVTGALGTAVRTAAGDWHDFLGGIAAGAARAGEGLRTLLGPALGLVSGLALTGIRNSAFGDIFAFQWAELARQIGSLFLPQIRAVSAALQQVINWSRGLTGEQQATYRQLLLTGAGLLAVAAALPRLVAGFEALRAVTAGVRVAMLALSAHPLIAIATAIAAVVVASYSLEEITAGVGKALEVVGAIARPILDAWVETVGELGRAFRTLGGEILKALQIEFPEELKDIAKFIRDVRFTKEQELKHGEGPPAWLSVATAFLSAPAEVLGLDTWLEKKFTGGKLLEAPTQGKHEELGLRGGQVESLDQTFKRLNAAALRATAGGMDEQQKQTSLQERIANAVDTIVAAVGVAAAANPPVVH